MIVQLNAWEYAGCIKCGVFGWEVDMEKRVKIKYKMDGKNGAEGILKKFFAR